MKKRKIIDLSKKEAREFFLESESYFSTDLPEYFNFEKFLRGIEKLKGGYDILNAKNDSTSYAVYNNKDGKYAWRKLELVHPIIYLELVNVITDNWVAIKKHFSNNETKNINCCPIYKKQHKHKKHKKTQILSYLEKIEKSSIGKSLNYEYMAKLDIANCYPSVYTHSISWALHSKSVAKNNRKNSFYKKGRKSQPSLLGNDIDFLLQAMQSGQTNGIPQGSVLMDFIAEIILTYIDKLLGDSLVNENITKYEIIRYRDDYRIFTKEKSDGEKIIKILSEILIDFNFKLNTNKTEVGEDIVLMSIKKDKLNNIAYHIGADKDIDVFRLKRLLLDILNTSKLYPNSGFILKMLQHFNEKGFYRKNKKWYIKEEDLLITILVNIVIKNPRCFAIACVSIFNLLPKLSLIKQKIYSNIIYKKLLDINNIGYNEIWLQRCLCKVDKTKKYKNEICKVVNNNRKSSIFGNHFINDPQLKVLLDKNNFIDRNKLSKISKVPKESELNIFGNYID